MSWFKRATREDGRTAINGRASPAHGGGAGRDRAEIDPDTCFEVFKNHWQQASQVIGSGGKKPSTNDDVETVLHNFEQMMTLLVGEEGIDGMPGPIVHFLLEKEVLETFCHWCSGQSDYQDKLCLEQLRMYELLISQGGQNLLIHRQVIRPLLRLLMACSEPQQLPSSGSGNSSSEELEFRLVLVLHQICTCISQETVILESFFSTEADHGPAKFLIFSLLIPYIHREGPIGQRARDALLLLMTLSAVHPHIGHYIADNSDFCPVLATGLSGLYSSLPRKIAPPSEDWYALTEEDCQKIVDLQMFLNSLEFCNAVVQVAHPLVRDQLIKYIYTGFLLPVLGPALHQDISGLPIPLLDTAMFLNSRDEVMTATAYLDLFLQRISEPHLIRAFLKFILTEHHDEILILESLITRINSNSKLSLVSLSLFHTLVDMNCEEVMFQLVFRYLIPCTHVMVSQRRAVRDLDLYGKSAEKFLSLRPVCCMIYPPPTPSPTPQGVSHTPISTAITTVTGRTQPLSRDAGSRSAIVSVAAELAKVPSKHEPKRRNIFRSKKDKKKLETLHEDNQKRASDSASSTGTESTAHALADDANAFSESSYAEYLLQARCMLEQCSRACRNWSAPYDGERPPPDSVMDHTAPSSTSAPSALSSNSAAGFPSAKSSDSFVNSNGPNGDTSSQRQRSNSGVKLVSHGNVPETTSSHLLASEASLAQQIYNKKHRESANRNTDAKSAAKHQQAPVTSTDSRCSRFPSLSPSRQPRLNLASLNACLDLDSFLACLNDLDFGVAAAGVSDACSVDQMFMSFDAALNSLALKPERSDVKKSVEFVLDVVEGGAENVIKRASSTLASSSTTPSANHAPVKDVKKAAEPPKTLNLSQAKDVSLGGKCRPRSLLRAPDDISRAFLMSPSSPGFFFSPSSPGFLLSPSSFSSAVNHPLPVVLGYPKTAPNIGPFLAAVFSRLEGMVGNSLYMNLLLTGLMARLAAYPNPLLRSFLLNVNLVFQPSVKSLVQVLSSVRQKVDSYSVTTPSFSSLIPRARWNLKMSEDSLLLPSYAAPAMAVPPGHLSKPRAATVSDVPAEKRKVSLASLLFRRSPKQQPGLAGGQHLQCVEVAGGVAYHFINSQARDRQDTAQESVKTWNAVYCALVLEEFLKELAALSQEHSVLTLDEGYASS